jgi:hypothetical protein
MGALAGEIELLPIGHFYYYNSQLVFSAFFFLLKSEVQGVVDARSTSNPSRRFYDWHGIPFGGLATPRGVPSWKYGTAACGQRH